MRRRAWRSSMTLSLASVLVLSLGTPGRSDPADLDPTFSGDGIVATSISGTDYAYGAALQPDGKIVAVGTANGADGFGWDFGVVRYLPNGSPDTSFSSDGKLTTPIGSRSDYATDVAVQPDGKIVVGGYDEISSISGTDADFALVRYNADGTLDTAFSGDGIVTTSLSAGPDYAGGIVVQPDGKIVAAGGAGDDFALARYNTNGSLDSTFAGTGQVITSIGSGADFAWDVALQTDGKIVAVGSSTTGPGIDFAVARFNTNGSLDVGFSGDGMVTTPIGTGDDYATSVALQPDGEILAAGFADSGSATDFALARYGTDGTLDPSLSDDGKLLRPNGPSIDYAFGVAVQPDGKILLSGESWTGFTSGFGVVRLTQSGALDPTFSTDGRLIAVLGRASQGGDLVLQPDGKIVVVGYTFVGDTVQFALARFVPVRTFWDVGAGYWAFDEIETLVASGITGGCHAAPPMFCPAASVTRAQMAVFLIKAMGEEGNLPSYKGYFGDVPAGQWYTGYVERLYELGVTAGCGGGDYCPSSAVSREQMAVFLLRGIGHAGHLAAYQGIFADVPASDPYARFIEHLYAHGVTSGCATNPLRYCPTASVTRAEMAVFLVKAFGL